jgi:hypothetical protein
MDKQRDSDFGILYLELRQIDSGLAEWAFAQWRAGATVGAVKERIRAAMAVAETYRA